jgi:lipopolysaccharide exporter
VAPSTDIAGRTLRGMAWAYGAYIGGKLIMLAATAVLARLLTPKAFGVVALAMTLTAFLEAIKDLGLSKALILVKADAEEEQAQTVFSWSLLLALGFTAITAAVGIPAASLFQDRSLVGLLPVFGACFTLNALGSTHYALARKHLHYRVRTVCEVAEALVRGGLSIGLALAGLGAWSLAIGYASGVAASSAAAWAMVPFRPRMLLGKTAVRDLFQFGGVLTLVDISSAIFGNLDYAFIGKVLGAAPLGLYSIGFRIPELAILNISHVAGDVLYPSFSAIDASRLKEALVRSTRLLAMLVLPITVGTVLLAHPIVLTVFGAKWRGAVPVTQAIALYALFAALAIPPGTALKVRRQARWLVLFSVPLLVALVVLLVLFVNRGITTVAWLTTALIALVAPVQYFVVSHQLRLAGKRLLGAFAPAVVCSATMAAAVAAVTSRVSGNVEKLIVGVSVGTVVYGCVVWLIYSDDVRSVWRLVGARGASGG